MALIEQTKRSQPTVRRRQVVAKSQLRYRRRGALSGWRLANVLTVGVMLGVMGGYIAFQATSDIPARGRVAEVARLQGQADAYVEEQQAQARSQAADATRLQAQADAYLDEQQAQARSQAADATRLQAQADATQEE